MTAPVSTVWSLDDWADAVIALPSDGVLPVRTVLVPNERVAHALRRALVARSPSALAGTRFLSLRQLAAQLVQAAGESAAVNEVELGGFLVREAIATVSFERFRSSDLLTAPGWDDAIARTLSELAACCVGPATLLASEDPQVRDVGRIYEGMDSGGEWRSTAGLLLQSIPHAHCATAMGSMLAVVTGFESEAEARLLRSLPNVHWARWGVRPERAEHLARLHSLFGDQLATAPQQRPPAERSTQIAHLQTHLFGKRKNAFAADGTVRTVIYAGVHEEVEAAVAWVVEQVLTNGFPAGELAILSPNMEVYAPLLRARLASLPWSEETNAVYSERGIPLVERSDGQRLLLCLRALSDGLSRETLAALLPVLRTRDAAQRVWGLSRAWELINAVAYVGGERCHPEGGLGWAQAWQKAIVRLETAAGSGGGLEERDVARRDSLRDGLTQVRDAVSALTSLLTQIIGDASLMDIASAIQAFATDHLKLPFAVPPALSVLVASVDVFDGHEGRAPRGVVALTWLEQALLTLVVKAGRFGEPRIYLGTLAGARGLSFRAVRLLGLVEGAVPSAVREDPLLPDAARALLSPLLPTSRQRAHRQLAGFDDAIRAAREQLVLSAPRVSAERSSRQPAAVLLDVMRVVGTGDSGQSLERQLEAAARSGRAHERAMREYIPVSPGARLDRIARGDRELARSSDGPALALGSLLAIRDRRVATVQDGLLTDVLSREDLPGLTAARPISASRLQTLLSCPHQYLYEHVLGFRQPESALPTETLPSNTFGTWLHGIAETFWRQHGVAIGSRTGGVEQHRRALRAWAEEKFEELRPTHPFANSATADAQRDALCDQLDKLLVHDWGDGTPREFVDVERGFGFTEPCVLNTAAGPLFVRGKIDKLDANDGTLLVRDVKTGTGRPRRAEDAPAVGIDLQLGLYAHVAKQLRAGGANASKVGVAYLYLRSGEIERSWTGRDYTLLERATKEWLATAVETLEAGAFVRTVDRNDCRFCPHQAVCSSELERAHGAMKDRKVPKRLVALKLGEQP
jgi:hypothetical protein